MSRGREIEDKQTNEEEIERDSLDEEDCENAFEEDLGEDLKDPNGLRTSKRKMISAIGENFGRGPWIGSNRPSLEKIRKCETNQCLDHDHKASGGYGGPEDADYFVLSQFNDELETTLFPTIPSELETMILARVGILEYRNLCSLGRRVSELIESGNLLTERKMNGIREACVFMLASGQENWRAFDQQFTHKTLPRLPSDDAFKFSDKESLCAGTHLLVCGHGLEGPIIWTYEVMMDEWYKGPSMVEPRCLFASASCGEFAFVAGGISIETNDVLSSAEKYDPKTKSWDPLPNMKEKRKMCAGVYMDNKFYVVGGHNQDGDVLTCAEAFDEKRNTWVKIPNMLKGLTTSQSPPLLAVVNNDLYLFETSSNCLMVYLKDNNNWKNVGPVPVRADLNKGWGVAFKSLGNELLVIGGWTLSPSGRGMPMFTCCPNPNLENQNWKLHDDDGENSRSHFIMNCTVMVA